MVCGADLARAEARGCLRCGAAYHPDCWTYAEGCATFGCGGLEAGGAEAALGAGGEVLDLTTLPGAELVDPGDAPALPDARDEARAAAGGAGACLVALAAGTALGASGAQVLGLLGGALYLSVQVAERPLQRLDSLGLLEVLLVLGGLQTLVGFQGAPMLLVALWVFVALFHAARRSLGWLGRRVGVGDLGAVGDLTGASLVLAPFVWFAPPGSPAWFWWGFWAVGSTLMALSLRGLPRPTPETLPPCGPPLAHGVSTREAAVHALAEPGAQAPAPRPLAPVSLWREVRYRGWIGLLGAAVLLWAPAETAAAASLGVLLPMYLGLQGLRGMHEHLFPHGYLGAGRCHDLLAWARGNLAGSTPGSRRASTLRVWEALAALTLGRLAETRAALAEVNEDALTNTGRTYLRNTMASLALREGAAEKALEILKDPPPSFSWLPSMSRVNELNVLLGRARAEIELGRFEDARNRLRLAGRSHAPANARALIDLEQAFLEAMSPGRAGYGLAHAEHAGQFDFPLAGRRAVLGLCLALSGLDPARARALLEDPREPGQEATPSWGPCRRAVMALALADLCQAEGDDAGARAALEAAPPGRARTRARAWLDAARAEPVVAPD